MSTVLVIPDSHLNTDIIKHGVWLADRFRVTDIVLLGDYYDKEGATYDQYKAMFDYMQTLLRSDPRVIPLIGNHELWYMGFDSKKVGSPEECLLKDHLLNNYRYLPSVAIDGIIYTHAGVTEEWIRENRICTENDIRYRVLKQKKSSANCLEENINGVPKWDVFIPKNSCMNIQAMDLVTKHAGSVRQIVGHSPVREITYTDGIWFTDVFSHCDRCNSEYLIVFDGHPVVVNYDYEWMKRDDSAHDRLLAIRGDLEVEE